MNRNFRNFKTLTVSELIERLQDMDPDARVVFTCDYGDYHHTAQALPIVDDVEQSGQIEESAYSHSGFALGEDDGSEDDEEEVDPEEKAERDARETFVVLRASYR